MRSERNHGIDEMKTVQESNKNEENESSHGLPIQYLSTMLNNLGEFGICVLYQKPLAARSESP